MFAKKFIKKPFAIVIPAAVAIATTLSVPSSSASMALAMSADNSVQNEADADLVERSMAEANRRRRESVSAPSDIGESDARAIPNTSIDDQPLESLSMNIFICAFAGILIVEFIRLEATGQLRVEENY